MHEVNLRRSRTALLWIASAALAASACSDEIQDPLVEEMPAQLAGGEFDGPHSVPTRGRIVFASGVTGDTELYSILEDGTGLVRLTYSAGNDQSPTWSPDGRKIAFISARTGTPQIYTINADGSGTKRLTSFPAEGATISGLRWSPDGRRLAFARLPANSNDTDIYTISQTGKGLRRLTNRPGADSSPAWSPDGNSLLFSSTVGDTYDVAQIVSMSADGSEESVFISCPVWCSGPAWSPDATRVLFEHGQDQYSYYVAQQQMQLVQSGSDGGVFSPDGVKIAYVDFDYAHGIVIANANGTNKTPITTFATGRHLDWAR